MQLLIKQFSQATCHLLPLFRSSCSSDRHVFKHSLTVCEIKFDTDIEQHKYKAKAFPRHTYGGAGGRGGISPIHWPRHKMRLSGQRHAPAALYPQDKNPIPIVQEAGWAPEPVWTQRLEHKNVVLACSLKIEVGLSNHKSVCVCVCPPLITLCKFR
jgi:hypothetical protein